MALLPADLSVSQPRGFGARGHCAPRLAYSPASPASRPHSALLHRSAPVGMALPTMAAVSRCNRGAKVGHRDSILMTPNSRDPSFRVCFRRRSPPTSRCHHKWSWMVLSFHYTPVDENFARLYLCPNPPWNPDICEKPPPRKPPKNPLRKPPTGAGTPWGTIDGRGATLNTGAAEEKILGP